MRTGRSLVRALLLFAVVLPFGVAWFGRADLARAVTIECAPPASPAAVAAAMPLGKLCEQLAGIRSV